MAASRTAPTLLAQLLRALVVDIHPESQRLQGLQSRTEAVAIQHPLLHLAGTTRLRHTEVVAIPDRRLHHMVGTTQLPLLEATLFQPLRHMAETTPRRRRHRLQGLLTTRLAV